MDEVMKMASDYKQNGMDLCEEGFIDYGTTSQLHPVPTTEEQFQQDIDQLIADIKKIEENPQVLEKTIRGMSKKNNGWLKKGVVGLYNYYEHTCRLWEDSYCYVMWALRTKASDEKTVVLSFTYDEKFTW
jgi:hypothetical protein